MSSPSPILLLLGASGVGKSTVSNAITGMDTFAVSHRRDIDGTLTVVANHGIVDTPGLDTSNAKAFSAITLRRPFLSATPFLVVIVINKHGGRFTTWSDRCISILNDLRSDLSVLRTIVIVWTHVESVDVVISDQMKEEVRNKFKGIGEFRHVAFHKDHPDRFRTAFAHARVNASLWTPVAPPTVPATQPSSKPKKANSKGSNALIVPMRSIFPKDIFRLDATASLKEKSLTSLIKSILDGKRDAPEKFTPWKVLGDAALRFLVYMKLAIESSGQVDLVTESDAYVTNKPSGHMPRLYDSRIHLLMPTEFSQVEGHFKADIVEALLGYCILNQMGSVKPLFHAIIRA